jgi:predicted transcriptional regulator
MSHAADLRAVRAHFGLSQPELGVWLGLGHSLLARVETHRDALPG